MVESTDEIGKSTAGVRQTNFKLGKLIEEPAKNDVSCGDCRIERISQKVMQVVAGKPLGADDIERMEKNRHLQCVYALEDRDK